MPAKVTQAEIDRIADAIGSALEASPDDLRQPETIGLGMISRHAVDSVMAGLADLPNGSLIPADDVIRQVAIKAAVVAYTVGHARALDA